MARFVIDEDLPRSLARHLRSLGVEADDVRDIGLRGAPDGRVFAAAIGRGAALITGDLGFSNILQFPLGTHAGILVVRLPNEMPTTTLNDLVARALRLLSEDDIFGNLVILEQDRLRLRRQGLGSP